ncbi:hypothetical protein NDU88_003118 [Pleurodeles waltl]|uniref:Uncharacterized protein n=1 Tax=Pleurodeles waltl TaxID=8319 RepID=A0AAV7LFT6_PLEWA|nr:hypothetical protein NDU88_003118 [Pleurodeles waltl]
MDGGSQASRPAPAGQCTGRGRSPGAFLLGRPATGIRRRGPVQAPQGLSPVFQPATHIISSAIGLASARPGASRSPSCFPSRDRSDLRAGIECRVSVFFRRARPPRDPGSQGCPNRCLSAPEATPPK